MPRNYLTFGDIEGKLDVLCVECTKCPRKGRYSVGRGADRQKLDMIPPAACRSQQSRPVAVAPDVSRPQTDARPGSSRLGYRSRALGLLHLLGAHR